MEEADSKTELALTTVYDLNEHKNEELLVLIINDRTDVIIMGCDNIHDIAFYTSYYQLLKHCDTPPEDWIILKARILDPENLPFDIDYGNCVFVIYEDSVLFRGNTIHEATMHIEGLFKMWADDIDDFAAISGDELPTYINLSLKRQIDKFDELIVEGGQYINDSISNSKCG